MRVCFYTYVLFLTQILAGQNYTVQGIVKDKETNLPVSFCAITLLNSGSGTVSSVDGKFGIEIPVEMKAPKLLVSAIGYKRDTVTVTESTKTYIIFLKPEERRLDEVVITGVSKATSIRENPVAMVSISAKMIERSSESNIIDAFVKNAPGLNAVKTGPNISKPFIRGLGYNRVLTLYDGVRQEGQQWGDEHGIEVDPYNIEKAEIVKGPASIMYGSDALAGVVSIMPYVPGLNDTMAKVKVISEYQSNNGLIGNGFRIGYRGLHWLWALKGSQRMAKNYYNAVDGKVYNTGFREQNASALLGYKSESGYSHLNFTFYDNLQGIPDGSRDSLSRKFTYQEFEDTMDHIKARPVVSDAQLNSYEISPLHQHIQHYRIYSTNHYRLGRGEMDGLLALQQNIRREYNHPTKAEQAGMYVCLNTLNYGLKYNAPRISNVELTIGFNGMYQNNKNKNATNFPIPDYAILDGGAYLYGKWNYKSWAVSGGLRYDVRQITGEELYVKLNGNTGFLQQTYLPDTNGARLQFAYFNQTFTGTSSSIGITYNASENISLKANLSRGYRAPNISEIASNGLDPGAHIVYIGNKNFVPEFSFQQDLGVLADFKNVSGTVSIFNNNMQHYIYLAQLADAQGKPVVLVPGNKTFQYQQASAHLYGLELTLNIHPSVLKGFNFNNNLSAVYGYNSKNEFIGKGINGGYLPFIPPVKILSSINQEINTGKKMIPAITIKAEVEYSAAQHRYLALYNTETPTSAYTLINMAAGITIAGAKKSSIQLQFHINNLFDEVYQSNLSRLKYFEYYAQSPNGKYGMYGMGRNFCFKLIFNL